MSTFNIYLNSKNADVYFNGSKRSDVRFIIKSSVNIDLDQEMLSVKLNHFDFSNTFYNITNKTNTISINNIDVTIPEGNYLIDDLLGYLNAAYTSNFSFTYDDVYRKVTITSTSGNITTISGSCLKLLGFEETTSYNNASITSPYVYNLDISQHLYVKSNFQVANIASFDKRSGYTLAYVPLGVFDSVVSYQNYSSAFLKTDTKNINYIDIKITDDEDEYVDFKNHNWSLSLEFLIEKLF